MEEAMRVYVNPTAKNKHGEQLMIVDFINELAKIFNVRYFDNLEGESYLFIEGMVKDGKEKTEAA